MPLLDYQCVVILTDGTRDEFSGNLKGICEHLANTPEVIDTIKIERVRND